MLHMTDMQDMLAAVNECNASLKTRLLSVEVENKELRRALDDVTRRLHTSHKLLVYAISNFASLDRERQAWQARCTAESAKSVQSTSVALETKEHLESRRLNSSSTQRRKLTIDYIMNVDGESDRLDSDMKTEIEAPEELLHRKSSEPSPPNCPYHSPPSSYVSAKEAKLFCARTNSIPIKQIIALMPLPEPGRSLAWMRAMFIEDPESEISQVEFWTLYKDAFSALAPQFPLLCPKDLLLRVSHVFPRGQAIEASGSVLMQRFVVRGVKRRC